MKAGKLYCSRSGDETVLFLILKIEPDPNFFPKKVVKFMFLVEKRIGNAVGWTEEKFNETYKEVE